MDLTSLVPRDKHDFERVEHLVAAGPRAVEPILPELLIWVQDINWPIAQSMAAFLVSVGEPLVPHLRKILRSSDDMWIYWTLQYIVAKLPVQLIQQLKPELYSLMSAAENDVVSLRVLVESGAEDRTAAAKYLANKLRSLEGLAAEVRLLQSRFQNVP